MSADLEFLQDLPKIRLPTSIRSAAVSSPAIRPEEDGDDCRTPTAEEHKIPAVLVCPPAPRKPKRLTVSCKRRLTELEFFEIAHRDEVDAFFRSAFETNAKRRCTCA